MSTILDALEKANQARRKGEGGALGAGPTARERQLAEAAERERRRTRILLFAIIAAIVLLLAATGTILILVTGGTPRDPSGQSQVALAPAPTATPVPTPQPTPEPTPVPSPTPTPIPPTPTPPPPTPAPSPTPRAVITPTPGRFSDSQVVYPADLNVRIEGALIDGTNSTIVIDGNLVDIGRKYRGIRPLAINGPLIEAEYDQGGSTVTIFIRYK
ncbi:MAG: hypothetical protein PWP23_1582 [Candidatus Sumerlaeota bacterium]|nr:hypothetical protein [Candidatus Sumerlaeota bacterium]